MKRLPGWIDSIIRMIYPDRCVCCGRIIDGGMICGGCEALIKRIPDNCCRGCSLPMQSCECGSGQPATDGFAAVFYDSGRAKRGIRRMKLQGSARAADFFGAEMAECFKSRFPDASADAICFVPTDRKSKSRHGFDHAERLARIVAAELYIPVMPDVLRRTRRCLPQHTLGREKRLKNVKGAFAADRSAKGRSFILIDDILTTGATINECARALKSAGAGAVYGLCAVRSHGII